MSEQSKVLSGKKVNDKHSTFNKLCGKTIKYLKKFPEITKIVLGPIVSKHGRNRKLKVTNDRNTIRVQCRDIDSIQIIWVYSVSKEYVEQKLNLIKDEFL